jgi:endonuclease YncB( thermonuclease family)
VIGKTISFKIEYTNTQIKREFGTVMLDDVNLNERIVAEGWAKVRPSQSKEPQSEYDLAMGFFSPV